jgi:hypothetical protein
MAAVSDPLLVGVHNTLCVDVHNIFYRVFRAPSTQCSEMIINYVSLINLSPYRKDWESAGIILRKNEGDINYL